MPGRRVRTTALSAAPPRNEIGDSRSRRFSMARNALTPSRARPSGLTGFNPLMSLNRDINRLFDDFLQPSASPTVADTAVATALITPRLNVSETATEIRVTAAFPGVEL